MSMVCSKCLGVDRVGTGLPIMSFCEECDGDEAVWLRTPEPRCRVVHPEPSFGEPLGEAALRCGLVDGHEGNHVRAIDRSGQLQDTGNMHIHWKSKTAWERMVDEDHDPV